MSLWLKGYEFSSINKLINDYLKLDKEIRLSFLLKKENGLFVFERNLIVLIIDNNKVIEKKIINPRKKINKSFNSLSKEDNEKLRNYLNKYGMDLLEFQHNKINFLEITKILGRKI